MVWGQVLLAHWFDAWVALAWVHVHFPLLACNLLARGANSIGTHYSAVLHDSQSMVSMPLADTSPID